jgi:acyl-CoA thioester hydrolase
MSEQPWAILREHRIRWVECDSYAHLNHAQYLTLFEDLRIAHWEQLAGYLPNADQPSPVVGQLEVRYARSVGFGDLVTLACRAPSFRRTSFVHEYALIKDGVPRCTARAVCVVTLQREGGKAPLPDQVRERLIAQGAVAEG